MRKKVLWVSIVIGILYSFLFFLIYTTPVYSAVALKSGSLKVKRLEGGEIKAQPIKDKEDEGYTCIVIGQTFEGTPYSGSPRGTPKSWFIPAGNTAPSKNTPTDNENIALTYVPGFKTPIVCIRVDPPDVAIVNLDTTFTWQVPPRSSRRSI